MKSLKTLSEELYNCFLLEVEYSVLSVSGYNAKAGKKRSEITDKLEIIQNELSEYIKRKK
jgi:hypothetical protein